MIVKVTQEHISNGQPHYGPKSDIKSYLLPLEASEFIDGFDKGEPVEPFEFEVSCVFK